MPLDISKIRERVEAKLRARGLPVPAWSKVKWEEALMGVRDEREIAKIEKAPLGVSGRAETVDSTLSNSKVGDNARVHKSDLQSTLVFGGATVWDSDCSTSLIYDKATVDSAHIRGCRIRDNSRVLGERKGKGRVVREYTSTAVNVDMSGSATIQNSFVKNAKVRQDASISGGASIQGYDGFVQIYGKAEVSGRKTEITHKAQIYGSAKVSNETEPVMDGSYEATNMRGERRVRTVSSVQIKDEAQVHGEAEIRGGVITDKAQAYGRARVRGTVYISQNAQVRGQATIDGNYGNDYWNVNIMENAIVEGQAIVEGRATICGNSIVGGTAHIGGDARIQGGVWDGKEGKITSGTWLAPGVRETK